MSFVGYKHVIEEGDTAILYISASSHYALQVLSTIKNKHGEEIENVFQTTYGALRVKSLIGKEFGSKVELSRGWAYILHPTCELWTVTLPHRTQIIYTPDISVILLQLEISPGNTVVESGTGSGSLSHALARCVGPSGKLFTFDFHEGRANIATKEFTEHGLSDIISVIHRDVCADGFGENLEGKADAVFLDLPHPWLAVIHALKVIKHSGGRLCSFSPCIEQVQKTCSALRNLAFVEINTIECLQREFHVVSRSLPTINIENKQECPKYSFVSSNFAITSPGHTGYLTFASLPPIWARGYYDQIEDQEEENQLDNLQEVKCVNSD